MIFISFSQGKSSLFNMKQSSADAKFKVKDYIISQGYHLNKVSKGRKRSYLINGNQLMCLLTISIKTAKIKSSSLLFLFKSPG